MGSYVEGNLIKDESIVYSAKLHWIIYISTKAFLTLFIAPLIEVATSEFAITNKRVIFKVRLISRKTFEMNLSKIETVGVDQSILTRILGYGTVTIVGTGGTREAFHRIASPLDFRKKFQELSS
jgi:uncharacterized membrane protein YdbT with pleckstrin-like domain